MPGIYALTPLPSMSPPRRLLRPWRSSPRAALPSTQAIYPHSEPSVAALVRSLYRYDLVLRHQRIEHTLPSDRAVLRLEYDSATGRAVARLYSPGKQVELGSYELLTELVDTEHELGMPTGRSWHPPKQVVYMRRALRKGQVRSFVLAEQSFDVPAAVGGLAELIGGAVSLLKAGMALKALQEDPRGKKLSDGKVTLYFEAGTETLQALTPATKLMAYPFRRTFKAPSCFSGLVRLSEGLGKAGASVAAVQGFVTSTITLSTFLGPETSTTDLANYLARGETTAAWLETTKSVVQVAVSAGEAAEGEMVKSCGSESWLFVKVGDELFTRRVVLGTVASHRERGSVGAHRSCRVG